jgi:hypothetical protein
MKERRRKKCKREQSKADRFVVVVVVVVVKFTLIIIYIINTVLSRRVRVCTQTCNKRLSLFLLLLLVGGGAMFVLLQLRHDQQVTDDLGVESEERAFVLFGRFVTPHVFWHTWRGTRNETEMAREGGGW